MSSGDKEKTRVHKAEQTHQSRQLRVNFDWSKLRIPIPGHEKLLVLFTLALAIVGLLQLCTLQATDETMRAGERAFVSAKTVDLTPTRLNGRILFWRASPVIQNSGTTPTRDMQIVALPLYGPRPTPNETEVSIPFTSPVRTTLGAKSEMAWGDAIIDRDAESKIMRDTPLFFVGLIKYRDILDSKAVHVTKYCFEVYGPPWKDTLPDAAMEALIDGVDLRARPCAFNNCTDNECGQSAKISDFGRSGAAPSIIGK